MVFQRLIETTRWQSFIYAYLVFVPHNDIHIGQGTGCNSKQDIDSITRACRVHDTWQCCPVFPDRERYTLKYITLRLSTCIRDAPISC